MIERFLYLLALPFLWYFNGEFSAWKFFAPQYAAMIVVFLLAPTHVAAPVAGLLVLIPVVSLTAAALLMLEREKRRIASTTAGTEP